MIEVKTELLWWAQDGAGRRQGLRQGLADDPTYASVKRLLDVVGSLLLLVCLAPVMVLIGLAVRLDSAGPVLFRQRRVGRWGREFTMFKFRSMYVNCGDDVHRKFAREYINGTGGVHNSGRVFKPAGDLRVTRVGRWLRRTSLDELPQLWNVLRGEMSLVGPRPAVRYEVDEYAPWHMGRLHVLPGLTGLAQVSGRSSLRFSGIVRLDLEYVRRRSMLLDLWILLRTVPVVFASKNVA